MELGNISKAEEYIRRTEEIMLEDGSLPELYYSNSDKYNGNTPLGWANALYIIAKEKLNGII
jgi:phosphorylase kinase alpha/beta subunit